VPTPKSAATEQRIAKAALHLFATSGYHASSVRRIAARAHTNEAAINVYFKSKSSLFSVLLDTAVSHFIEDLAQTLATRHPNHELLVDVVTRHRELLHLAMTDFTERGGEHITRLIAQHAAVLDDLRPALMAAAGDVLLDDTRSASENAA